MKAIEEARRYSKDKLQIIRSDLTRIVPSDHVVVTCGSFARREASPESDIDYFIIAPPGADSNPPWSGPLREAIARSVVIEPATDGAFAEIEPIEAMLLNIGGDHDSNHKITRRMLFLLEGEWLFNEDGLKRARRLVLERYISSEMTDHQLALFLLNDVIRYYRTMAVDYEFKTSEGDNPKPWGIRNIKLVFSRKLLYASGLFSVAMTADRSSEQKISYLENLFEIPVIDRMVKICGASNMDAILQSYNYFLEQLSDQGVRQRLKELDRKGRSDPIFRELKNEGHHFTRELLKLFESTFDSTHPIRRAVVF
jgi:hypothetical protein